MVCIVIYVYGLVLRIFNTTKLIAIHIIGVNRRGNGGAGSMELRAARNIICAKTRIVGKDRHLTYGVGDIGDIPHGIIRKVSWIVFFIHDTRGFVWILQISVLKERRIQVWPALAFQAEILMNIRKNTLARVFYRGCVCRWGVCNFRCRIIPGFYGADFTCISIIPNNNRIALGVGYAGEEPIGVITVISRLVTGICERSESIIRIVSKGNNPFSHIRYNFTYLL